MCFWLFDMELAGRDKAAHEFYAINIHPNFFFFCIGFKYL